MAESAKTTAFKGKINNQLIKGNLLSDSDVAKVKTYHGKVDTLETNVTKLTQRFDASLKDTKQVALYDFYTNDTHKDKMEVGRVYMVYFTATNEFVKPNSENAGEPYWPADKKPAYYWLVRKTEDDQRHKLMRVDDTGNAEDYLSKTRDNEFTGYMMRTILDADVQDGDAVPYMTKYMGIDANQNPAKAVYSGHLALDKANKKLFAHTGVLDKNGNRQASLGVYKKDGSAAGEVCLKSNPDGTQVTLTIPPVADVKTAQDNQAVNVKALKQFVAEMPNFKYQSAKPDDSAIQNGTVVFYDAENLLG